MTNPIGDVVESCADALLTAVGALFITTGQEVLPDDVRTVAIAYIDIVLQRTEVEGAKPR